MAAVRALLESWFANYTPSERADLKARFIAEFHGAFFELLLFSYFTRDGYHMTPHPQVTGSGRTPDFLAERGACRFYLEATVARDVSDEDARHKNVKARLLDAINDTPSPNFFLHLRQFTVAEGMQPAARRLKAFLERELPKIDPDSIDLSLEAGPALQYQDEALTATIGLVPRSLGARGRTDIRPIGIYPMQTKWGGSDALIREAVNFKATRYGALELPYIVGVNCLSEWGVDDDDILNALFGTEQVTLVRGSHAPILSRKKDGAFIRPSGPSNTRVSAVLAANIYPWGLKGGRLELYCNPWAAKRLTDCAFPLRRAVVVKDSLEWSGETDMLGHFGLPPGWPD